MSCSCRNVYHVVMETWWEQCNGLPCCSKVIQTWATFYLLFHVAIAQPCCQPCHKEHLSIRRHPVCVCALESRHRLKIPVLNICRVVAFISSASHAIQGSCQITHRGHLFSRVFFNAPSPLHPAQCLQALLRLQTKKNCSVICAPSSLSWSSFSLLLSNPAKWKQNCTAQSRNLLAVSDVIEIQMIEMCVHASHEHARPLHSSILAVLCMRLHIYLICKRVFSSVFLLLMHSQEEKYFRVGLLWLIISEGTDFCWPGTHSLHDNMQSNSIMKYSGVGTLLVDITSVGTSAFAECTIREI